MSATVVTGASGFVGLPVLHALRERGEVHALSRSAPPEAKLDGVTWHQIDLADGAAVAELMARIAPERMVHLAWYVEHGRFWSAPENVDWVEHSLALLRAFAAAGGRRAVLLGTCAEYDWSDAAEPLRELDSPLAPATLYGVAKDALRRLAEAYAHETGFELAWGRPFFFFGPRESPDRLVPAVARSLLAGEPVETTDGRQLRDFLHVDDVAGAIVAMLDSDVQGPVNIGSGEAVAVIELVRLIASEIGRPDLIRAGALPARAGEPPVLVADVARLRDEVGFRPRWELAEALADTIRWWRSHA